MAPEENDKQWLAASRSGDLPAMQALIAASEAPAELAACREQGNSSSGHSALHWAAAGGHLEAATWLLSLAGTDVLDVNHGGSTALHSAAANDRAALVELLLEHGAAAANVKDANGDTPFGVAALREHEAAARLLAHSARPHAYLRLSLGGTGPLGMLLFELDSAAAPKAVANFLGFASGASGMCYRGTVFHRLLPGQTLQGGQFKGGQFKGSIFGAPFADERAGLSVRQDRRGLLCMANSGPNSNGSQFYLTLAPCEHLSGSHVVFGKLVPPHVLTVPPRSSPTPSRRSLRPARSPEASPSARPCFGLPQDVGQPRPSIRLGPRSPATPALLPTQVAGDAVLEAAGSVPADDADRPTLPISISECGRWPPPPPMAAAESAPEPSVSLGEVAQEADAKIGQVLPARTPSCRAAPTFTLTFGRARSLALSLRRCSRR